MSSAEAQGVVKTIVRADTIQQFVDQASAIVSECILTIGSDGISTRAVDPANAAMVDIQITASACESTPGGSFVAGVDLNKLDDYLGAASGDDPVSFAFNPEDRTLNLRHTNREFNVALIDPDTVRDEPDIPDLEFTTDVTLPSAEWADAIDTADLVSDHVTFEADADAGTLEVRCEGDIDDVTVTFEGDDFGGGSEIDADTKSLYSVPYMTGDSGLLSPVPSCDLRVRFAEDHPIKYNYEFADGNATVEAMCAPRIQAD